MSGQAMRREYDESLAAHEEETLERIDEEVKRAVATALEEEAARMASRRGSRRGSRGQCGTFPGVWTPESNQSRRPDSSKLVKIPKRDLCVLDLKIYRLLETQTGGYREPAAARPREPMCVTTATILPNNCEG